MSYLQANMEAAAILGDCLLAEAGKATASGETATSLTLYHMGRAFLKASGQMKERIVAQAGGAPVYVEELLSERLDNYGAWRDVVDKPWPDKKGDYE